MNNMITRRRFLSALAAATGGTLLAACAPKVVKETVVVEVEKAVKETVVVEKAVEKLVKETVIVEATPKVVEKVVTAPPAPKAPVTIIFETLHPTWFDYSEKFNDPAFEKEFPNVKVKRELSPVGEFHAKVLMMHAAGTPMDVIHTFDQVGAQFEWAVKGVLKNLDPLINRDKFDMNQFYPQMLDICRRPYGQYLMFPACFDPGNIALYYNKSLLKKAGVPEPTPDWTWTGEFEQALRDINKALNPGGKMQVAPWVGMSSDIKTIQPLIYAWGGLVFDKDGYKCLLGEEKAKSALKWYQDLLDEGVITRPDFSTEGDEKLFIGQRAVFISYWMSLASMFFPAAKEGGWEISATVSPKGSAGIPGSWAAYHILAIHSDSQYPDEAWEYIKFYTSEKMAESFWTNCQHFSARIADWQNPKLTGQYPFWKQIADILPTAKEPYSPANLRGREALAKSAEIMGPMWLGQTKFEEGMTRLVQEIQAILDLPTIK